MEEINNNNKKKKKGKVMFVEANKIKMDKRFK